MNKYILSLSLFATTFSAYSMDGTARGTDEERAKVSECLRLLIEVTRGSREALQIIRPHLERAEVKTVEAWGEKLPELPNNILEMFGGARTLEEIQILQAQGKIEKPDYRTFRRAKESCELVRQSLASALDVDEKIAKQYDQYDSQLNKKLESFFDSAMRIDWEKLTVDSNIRVLHSQYIAELQSSGEAIQDMNNVHLLARYANDDIKKGQLLFLTKLREARQAVQCCTIL